MKTDLVIIGAGITGLCCSYFSKQDHLVFEKNNQPGGVCRTEKKAGFYFDYAEHFIRIPNEAVKNLLINVLKEKLFSQELNSKILIDNNLIPYPFQKSIYYLSNKNKKVCLEGFINRKKYSELDEKNFGNWFLKNYGDGISKLFMYPYNQKIWCIDPHKIRADFSFDPNLIPEISLDNMLDYTFFSIEERAGIDKYIRYYIHGEGISELPKALAKNNKDIIYNKEVFRISPVEKRVYFLDGTCCEYNKLVSTIPINLLVNFVDNSPDEIKEVAADLKYNSVYILNFALNRKIDFGYHWLYIPEPNYQFSRIYSLNNFSKDLVPRNKSSLSVLTTYLPGKKSEINREKIISQILGLNYFNEDDIEFVYEQDISYGFTIPTLDSVDIVKKIKDYLSPYNIYTIGRYGEWRYLGIEHAISEAEQVCKFLEKLDTTRIFS